jgi:hypothetical protein
MILLFVGGGILLSWLLTPKVEYLPTGNRNLVMGILIPPPGYNLNQLRDMGELVEGELRPYFDVDPGTPEAANLKFPIIEDFFFVARSRSVFMGIRAHDTNRVAELVPLIQSVAAKLPAVPGVLRGLRSHGRDGRTLYCGLCVLTQVAHAQEGLPAAMGAKVAHPDALVVDIDGDGSILMNIQEFATCRTEDIAVKVLLLNNQHLGMVVQWEDRFFKGNRAHTYLGPVDHPEACGQGDGISPDSRYPDFVAIARGFGWQAETIREKSDLVPALRRLIDAPGPALLDVQVPYQEHVLPMIPSGMTVRDLIKR